MWHRLLGTIILIGTLLAGWLAMDFRYFADAPLALPEQGMRYILEPGSSVNRLAADLRAMGVLQREYYLRMLARWEGQANHLKAGEYYLPAGMTPRRLLERIVSGQVVQHSLTLVEGWTFRQVMRAVDRQPALTHRLTGLTDAEIMQRIGHAGEHPEGRFFPDTYHFPRGMSDISFLQRAYDAMARRLRIEWARRDPGLPLARPYDALILASIVERETGRAAERAKIAGVFLRRLQKGMRLQTDPTVIYGLGERFDGNLRRRDLQTKTPYNTYTNHGLPPTPIAMPGADAIIAVLHPAAGTALYFVARGDGSHQFSETLAEHNRAVRRYQLKK